MILKLNISLFGNKLSIKFPTNRNGAERSPAPINAEGAVFPL